MRKVRLLLCAGRDFRRQVFAAFCVGVCGFWEKVLVGDPSTACGGPPRTERSPLSLRDISPPRGESPLSGEAFGMGKVLVLR